MNPLCEITDPDEVAAMLGNLSAEKAGSASRSFTSLLGRANRAADVQEMNRPLEDEPEAAPEEEMVAAAPTATSRAFSRDELSGLIEKVRNLQLQFER